MATAASRALGHGHTSGRGPTLPGRREAPGAARTSCHFTCFRSAHFRRWQTSHLKS